MEYLQHATSWQQILPVGFTKGEGEVADEHRTRIPTIVLQINEGEGTGESTGSGLGTLLEMRNGRGKTRRSIRRLTCWRYQEDWKQQTSSGKDRKRSRIVPFADNVASIKQETRIEPREFVEMATTTIFDENIRARVEVTWVPGYMNIESG